MCRQEEGLEALGLWQVGMAARQPPRGNPALPDKATGWFLVAIPHHNRTGAFAKRDALEGIQGDTEDVGVMLPK